MTRKQQGFDLKGWFDKHNNAVDKRLQRDQLVHELQECGHAVVVEGNTITCHPKRNH